MDGIWASLKKYQIIIQFVLLDQSHRNPLCRDIYAYGTLGAWPKHPGQEACDRGTDNLNSECSRAKFFI